MLPLGAKRAEWKGRSAAARTRCRADLLRRKRRFVVSAPPNNTYTLIEHFGSLESAPPFADLGVFRNGCVVNTTHTCDWLTCVIDAIRQRSRHTESLQLCSYVTHSASFTLIHRSLYLSLISHMYSLTCSHAQEIGGLAVGRARRAASGRPLGSIICGIPHRTSLDRVAPHPRDGVVKKQGNSLLCSLLLVIWHNRTRRARRRARPWRRR